MPISWEDALRRIVERMAGLTDKSRFLMVTQPLRGHQALLASEFVKAYGGRSMAFEAMEQVTLRRAILDVFGQERLPVFDIKECKYLLSFGADFLSTWLSPVKYSRGYGELRQGSGRRGLHVQVDPRFSMTAANADEWVPVRPGGEGVPGHEHGLRHNSRTGWETLAPSARSPAAAGTRRSQRSALKTSRYGT